MRFRTGAYDRITSERLPPLRPRDANETESRIPLADLLVFHGLARSLTSSFDLDTILRTILEHMERLVDAEMWTLLMLDESQQELYYAIAAGQAQTPCAACA